MPEKIKLNIYNEYRDTIDRFMELVPCVQEERVDTATLHILYAINDINVLIEKCNTKLLDISIYYQMMIKIDFLIAAIEMLYQTFKSIKESKRIWKDSYKSIQKFRLYRSLTLAHPLETTYYKDFGYGNENDKWCEDVHVKGSIENLLNNELDNADFIMEIKEKGKMLPTKTPIYIKDDILINVSIALESLSIFTQEIRSEVNALTEELKKKPIRATRNLSITEFIGALLGDVEERYPSEIEKIKFEDDITEKHNILNDAIKMLDYTFSDSLQEDKYNIYKKNIKSAVYSYADSIQNMNLVETKARDKLYRIIHPRIVLSSKSKLKDAHYRYAKIEMYLAISNERSVDSASSKLKQFTYDGCKETGVCTNAEWGVIQLLTIKNELDPYFPIDLNVADRILYIQYCTALYYANCELK